MRNSLETISPLDPLALDSARYFESLLQEAQTKGLLAANELERLQCDCLSLLAHQADRYNSGTSSSIPVEKAQVLMTSLLFTLSLCLKTYPSPEAAVSALKAEPLPALFEKGRRRIQTMLASSKIIYVKLTRRLIRCPNEFYHATILGGISGFFKLYAPDFAAQDIHITADYPVLPPLPRLEGIEFIRWYLDCLSFENQFCVCFSSEDIHRLFRATVGSYEEQLFNLCEPVLLTALGCVLTGGDPLRLTLSAADAISLNDLFSPLSEKETAALLQTALDQLTAYLDCPQGLTRYLQNCLPLQAAHVHAAAKAKTLHRIFPPPASSESKPSLSFSFGVKMDDQQYRRAIEEIDQCRYTSDKLTILSTQFHSLADLSDALLDADWSPEDLQSILCQLPLPAFAALAKRHLVRMEADVSRLSSQEGLLQECLQRRIEMLPPHQREMLTQVMAALEEEFS